MVKTKGPALSLDATGTLGDTVTFAKWKGKNYLRRRVKGKQPRSGAQVSGRAMFAFLSKEWQNIISFFQETWIPPAAAQQTSAFNAFLQENLKRWRRFLAPGQLYPVTATGAASDLSNEAATAHPRSIKITADVDAPPFTNWGVMIFRAKTTPVVPAWDNCIAVIPAPSNTWTEYWDSPLHLGTYYYQFREFNTAAGMTGNQTEVNATVTS